jgi:transcriptional regulator with GAF, ATPase, and Fis domain
MKMKVEIDSTLLKFLPQHSDNNKKGAILRKFHDKVFIPSSIDLRAFYDNLTQVFLEIFECNNVTVWDFNKNHANLSLQSSSHRRPPELGTFSINVHESITGLSVLKRKLMLHDLKDRNNKELLQNEKILQQFNIKWILTIPVFKLSINSDILFVVNLYYSCVNFSLIPISNIDLERILHSISITYELLQLREIEIINNLISSKIPQTYGISTLFDSIQQELRNILGAKHLRIYSWKEEKCILKLERYSSIEDKTYIDIYNKIEDLLDGYLLNLTSDKTSNKSIIFIENNCIAVPLFSITNRIIGAIACFNPINGSNNYEGCFSSTNINTLVHIAIKLAPYFEKLLKIRENPKIVNLIESIAYLSTSTFQLNKFLNSFLEIIVKALNSETGSIYIYNKAKGLLEIAAVYGRNKALLEKKAAYKVGQGLTGSIAENRKTLNLKSLDEVINHPKYSGTYKKEVWGQSEEDCHSLLGVPLVLKNELIGLVKLANVSTNEQDFQYFSDEDEKLVETLSAFLSYFIENENKWFRFVSYSKKMIDIHQSKIEDDAISATLIALNEMGYSKIVFSMFHSNLNSLIGLISDNAEKIDFSKQINYKLSSDHILVNCLIDNKQIFIANPSQNESYDLSFLHKQYKSLLIIPLKIGDENIGVLHLDIGDVKKVPNEDEIILNSIASQLTITISRLRSIRNYGVLSEDVMSSSRFIIAETLSSTAVHSTKHHLLKITREIEKSLKKQEIRSSQLLLNTFESWYDKLQKLTQDLKNALEIVRVDDDTSTQIFDVDDLIQDSIDIWIDYIKGSNCTIHKTLFATTSKCEIKPYAFQEIISVLIVNSVQAHAKNIKITSYNSQNILAVTGHTLENAYCLEFGDDGKGLDTLNIEEIFSANYSTKSKKYGTGLGLFIARKIAKRAGGNLLCIENKDSRKKGATFKLILPIKL